MRRWFTVRRDDLHLDPDLDTAAGTRNHRPPARRRPVGARGIRGAGGGRPAFVPVPLRWRGTTRHVCGMYPWTSPGRLPLVGTPIGRHQSSGEPFCFDHISWFDAGFLSNPSVAILARPGLGKSTLAIKIMTGLVAQGYVLLVPGDTKPDYTELIRELGGEIRTVKRSGGWAFNPCDPGGMIAASWRLHEAAAAATHQARGHELATASKELFAEAIGRSVTVLAGLIELSRRSAGVADYEESVLAAALRHLHAHRGPGDPEPVIDDLIGLIRQRHDCIWQELELEPDDLDEYDRLTRPLRRSLRALVGGKFGDVFARPANRQAFPNAMVIDTAAIKSGDSRFLAAVLLTAWGDTYAQVEADQALADAGLAPRRLYCLTLDELWRVMDLGGSLPERVNETTRLNRGQGIGQMMISHSIADINETGKGTTDGMIERAGALIIGGTTKKEIARLDDVVTLTGTERSEISRWWSISQAAMTEPARDQHGRLIRKPPPGAGKFLIKASAEEPGIPVDVTLTSVERDWGGQRTSARFDRDPQPTPTHRRQEPAA